MAEVNLGFEEGLVGWVATAVTVEASHTNAAGHVLYPHDGAMAVLDTVWDDPWLVRDFTLSAGQTLSGWVAADALYDEPDMVVIRTAWVSRRLYSLPAASGMAWVPFSFQAPADGLYSLAVTMHRNWARHGDSQYGLLDDLQITDGVVSPPTNLGFELGTLAEWTVINGAPGIDVVGSHIDTETGVPILPHDGNFMLRMRAWWSENLANPDTPSYNGVTWLEGYIWLTAGQQVSCWMAVDGGDGIGRYYTIELRSSAVEALFPSQLGSGNVGWTEVSALAPATDYYAIRITAVIKNRCYRGNALLISGFTVSDAPQSSSQTGAVQVPIRCEVSTTGAVRLGLVVNVGGGAVRAALGFYVSARGRAVAPLYVVRRNPRFALRAAGDPLPPRTYSGAAYLALVCNVYDTVIAGIAGSVESCSLRPGLRACMGANVCIAPWLGANITPPMYAICSPVLPFVAFAGYGAVRLPLLIRVVPTAQAGQVGAKMHLPYLYGSPEYTFKIEPVGGRLVLPLQLGGQGAELYPVGSDRRFAVPTPEVAPVLFGETMNLFSGCNPRELVIGTWSASGISGVSLYWCSLHPDSPLRVSSMMRGHARYESEGFSWEVWPDGTASLTRWAKYWGKEGLTPEGGAYLRESEFHAYSFPEVDGVHGIQHRYDNYLGPYRWIEYTVWTPRVARDDSVHYPTDISSLYDATLAMQVVDTLLEDTAVYGGNRAVVLLDFSIGQTGVAVAPLLVGVGSWRGSVHLWLITQVFAAGVAVAALEINIYFMGGGQAVAALLATVAAPATGSDSPWRYAVRVGGVDVSARILGEIKVEAEAGAARIAEFTLAPVGVALDLAAAGSDSVEIDYCPPEGGEFWRLFSGKLAEHDFDVGSGALACTCSDQRAPLLDALDAPGIEALTPGAVYSPTAQGEGLVGAALAAARLETLAADLDLSPHGSWRLSPWESAASPRFVMRERSLIDESLSVRLMRYADVVPRVEVSFEYRYPLLRERQAVLSWSYSDCAGAFLLLGTQPFYLTGDLIAAAGEQDGWVVPDLAAAPSQGNLTAASWTQRRRYVQTVTEVLALSVRAPLAEAAYGARRVGARSATLAAEFEVAADWESRVALEPQLDLPGFGLLGEARLAMDSQTVDGRAVANTAIQALLMMARREVLASLRGSRVSARVPLNPRLDLPHTVRFETARVTAVGRVVRLVHTLDGERGSAITEIEVAAFATPGVNPADTPLLAPAALTAPAADLAGFAPTLGGAIVRDTLPEPDWEAPGFSVHYSVSTVLVDHDNDPETAPLPATTYAPVRSQFVVHLPAIPDADAQPLTLTHAADYLVAVPIDPFVLNG